MRIGLFGGSFNPIHYGHLRGAEEVREAFRLDKIIFIPSGKHPLKGAYSVADFHRLNMVKMAIKDNSYFEVSDFEITQRVTSYTLNTVKYFKRLYSDDTLFFIIGIDSFLELPFWYKPEELLKMIDFIIMSRPGFNRIESSEFIEKKQDDYYIVKNSERKVYPILISSYWISSTSLREMIRNRKSIRYLVPEEVRQYIEKNQLYKEI